MTDNQKRAHDFALTILPRIPAILADQAASQGSEHYATNLYSEYIRIYTQILESLNRDFPEGK